MTRSVLIHRREAGTGVLLSADSFNRTDSTSNLGATDGAGALDPKTWVQNVGTWGILSNTAYLSAPLSANQLNATVDLATPDVDISVTILTITNDEGLIFRTSGVGIADCWILRYNSGSRFQLIRRVAGTGTVIVDVPATVNSGDIFRVVAVGASITGFLNGVAKVATTDSANQTRTKHGLFQETSSVSATYDNWLVKTP